MEPGRQLHRLMEAGGLSQADVAQAAGVSQPTVSRVLRREPGRRSEAYRRLCSYIQQEVQPADDGPREAFASLWRVWDGTDDHAAALADLIEASGRLWPDLAPRTDDHKR